MRNNNYEITETQLRENVQRTLDWSPNLISTDIGVSVSENIVTLRGFVDTPAEKEAAERIVAGIREVRGIANEIEVRHLSALSDTEIARNAAHCIDSLSLFPADHITVTVSNGLLKLEGCVKWMFEKVAAESAVRDLLGVRGVLNELQVAPINLP